ncbi:MAG: hypothetical protein QGI09_09120, partial [Dehalococcoidia bacterium]|nr:hypothetical protein [Dehalococcoidia bacterium]
MTMPVTELLRSGGTGQNGRVIPFARLTEGQMLLYGGETMDRLQASRLDKVEPPATIAAGERARQLSRQGKDIIDLGQSSPHHVT